MDERQRQDVGFIGQEVGRKIGSCARGVVPYGAYELVGGLFRRALEKGPNRDREVGEHWPARETHWLVPRIAPHRNTVT